MGFLQGIIADARSSASGPMIDGSMSSIVGNDGGWNPTDGIKHGETGMGESRPEGIAVDSDGSTATYREASIGSSHVTETGSTFRSAQITPENKIFASDDGDNWSRPSTGNVERDEVGIRKSHAAGNNVDYRAESPVAYREPSVFSGPVIETEYFPLADASPRIGGSNHDETTSEPVWRAEGLGNLENHDTALMAEGLPEFKRLLAERQAQPVLGSPASTERAIEAGVTDGTPAFDRGNISAPRFSDSKRLPAGEGARTGLLLQEADVRPFSGHRGAKHVEREPGGVKDASWPSVGPERGRQPPSAGSTAAVEAARSARPQEKRPVEKASGETITGWQILVTQHQAQGKRIEEEGKAEAAHNKTERHQREKSSLAGQRIIAAQSELPIRQHAHQERGRSTGVIASHPARQPEVRIGQVDVFIEAPRKAAASDRASPKAQNTLSSRHYLRRI